MYLLRQQIEDFVHHQLLVMVTVSCNTERIIHFEV
jgi:hypothetical protein